jgi:hypothetical protein
MLRGSRPEDLRFNSHGDALEVSVTTVVRCRRRPTIGRFTQQLDRLDDFRCGRLKKATLAFRGAEHSFSRDELRRAAKPIR